MPVKECLEYLVYITPVLAGESVGDCLALGFIEFPVLFISVCRTVRVIILCFRREMRCGS